MLLLLLLLLVGGSLLMLRGGKLFGVRIPSRVLVLICWGELLVVEGGGGLAGGDSAEEVERSVLHVWHGERWLMW